MSTKKSILFVIAGIICSIILSFCQLIIPDIFHSTIIAKLTSILSLLSHISILIFGYYFITQISGKDNFQMNLAVGLAMLGPIYFTFRSLIYAALLFNDFSLKLYEISPELHRTITLFNQHAHYPIILIFNSVFLFAFFYMLFKNLNKDFIDLSKAIRFVLAGIVLMFVFRIISYSIYLFQPNLYLVSRPPITVYIIGFLIFVFSSACVIYFFMRLYHVDDYSKIIMH